MTLEAALWSSSTALTGKAALAFWTAALLFRFFDRRNSVMVWQILLAICVLAGCIIANRFTSTPAAHWMWLAGAVIACLSSLLNIRLWLGASPLETYEEASSLDRTNKKESDAKSKHPQALKVGPTSSLRWLDLLGLLIIAAALAISVYSNAPSPKTNAWQSTVHTLAACALWGVGVFCGLELTFGSTPLSLSAVSWSGVARVALLCWIAETCVAAAILLAPVDHKADLQSIAMTRLFAISILLMDFVVWMIPHRVATFRRTGKATAWVSLTLAAWLGTLSLAVLCALPSSWPWRSV